jgi:outer membrane protein assembly factor BamE (lipoprotein component of BamABCDE complex)
MAGCSSIKSHRGYIVDEALVQAVQPGIDNARSVEAALGRPTFQSQFGQPTWYYVSSVTAQKPLGTPQIQNHTVLAVQFDASGNVISAERSGMNQIVRIDPDGDKTRVSGSERSFIEDLFGNIGQVGTPGLGSQPQ